ncbi:ribonuclease H-like protein [Aspergillus affinis]|uniref:ribonuclease H-like protein n=1 Tax=Aspergillus affinis TaxID=1070780 RepID=UPI0022FF0A07|nr:ribonuclease H-like protein [Aspergillus affinis]KAI9041805.1 ribonuclease H-like protein [Aspergillus affinis]
MAKFQTPIAEMVKLAESLEKTSIQETTSSKQDANHAGGKIANPNQSLSLEKPLRLTERLQKTSISEKKEKNAFDFVDTTTEMAKVVEKCRNLPVSPPSLFIDLEGVDLGRTGSISIMQIYIRPLNYTYLIDVYTLKDQAFSKKGASGKTLRNILEAPEIPKVIFDVRHDSDALNHHYNVKLAGVQDLQLMELATRPRRSKFVSGLKKCVEHDLFMSEVERKAWVASKEKGIKLFAPERGGSYEVFNERPLRKEIVRYCVEDVHYLPRLWDVYDRKLTPYWRTRVDLEGKNRVRLSQSSGFNGKSKNMALVPLGW